MDEIVVEVEHKLTGLAGTRIELVALKKMELHGSNGIGTLVMRELGSTPRCGSWRFFVHRLKRTKWWKVCFRNRASPK